MPEKFFITTPIYYVNDEPHVGHAYCTIMADILARYHRMFGDQVFFLTGTDEHGQKVAEAAQKAERTPQQQCDLMVQRFQAVWKKLNISHDDFIRTTEERHKIRVQEILIRLWEKGEIYEAEYEGWYCVPEERFWTEKDLVSGNCPSCGREVRRLTEKNYFFRMGKYQDWLIDYIKKHPRFILPESRRNEILGFLTTQPLGDLCISRPKERLAWGIPLPFDDKFVTYVWFDALFNYYTAPESLGVDWWPASLHLIGKDILTTHCVYWPTMLKASGLDLPQTIFGHGWWMVDHTKMSKSLGNVVKPLQMADKYGIDAFRFFLVREMSFGMDSSFSEVALVNRYNSELANDFGNLYSRLLKLIHTFCAGKIPAASPGDQYGLGGERVEELRRTTIESIGELRPNAALDKIMNYVRSINRSVDSAAPWKSGKTDPSGTCAFLRQALEALANAACLLYPVMPEKMGQILSDLGVIRHEQPCFTKELTLPTGHALPEKAMLFPRIEFKPPKTAEIKSAPIPSEGLITVEDFKKVKLRIARIISAELAPNSDKLLQLQVDLGSEQRQIVAGIAQQYQPADLVGKLVVVVANLEPARIRGIESQGMLLAASEKGKLVVLTTDGDIGLGAGIS
ncbi:MAG: methionine--tRNA ligase [bacterium]|nr:methionine--tRNA ligase [bacterium]